MADKFPNSVTSYNDNSYMGSTNYNNSSKIINGFSSEFPSTITSYDDSSYAGSNYDNSVSFIEGFDNEQMNTNGSTRSYSFMS
jgi:hypothetical protein